MRETYSHSKSTLLTFSNSELIGLLLQPPYQPLIPDHENELHKFETVLPAWMKIPDGFDPIPVNPMFLPAIDIAEKRKVSRA